VKPEHLYVHVPFCLRRCSYCDFAVQAVRRAPVDAWLGAIEAELSGIANARGWSDPLQLTTLYVGGGTPSLLGCGAMAALARGLAGYARWDPDAIEWTAEANPESLTAEVAADWREAGVNRISLGIQTFDERVLRWMGRLHGAEGARAALDAARGAGLTNFSVDLIFALPRRLERDLASDLDAVLRLEPPHVSLYGLTAEPSTPLGKWVNTGRERLPDAEVYADEYLLAVDRLTRAGYRHYEVSNFALPGHESRHNIAYWRRVPYLGLGPGAHSYLPPERFWNERGWDTYRALVQGAESPVAAREIVDEAAAALERIWLGLRTAEGLASGSLSAGQQRLARAWAARGWAEMSDDSVRLTAEGWLLLDRLAVELDAARGSALDAAPAHASHSTAAGHPKVGAAHEPSDTHGA